MEVCLGLRSSAWFDVFIVDKGHDKWVNSLGRVFKIHDIFGIVLRILTLIRGMIKWVTPLGVR